MEANSRLNWFNFKAALRERCLCEEKLVNHLMSVYLRNQSGFGKYLY